MERRFKAADYAASELATLHEDLGALESGDDLTAAVMQWTGTHIIVFDAQNAQRVASGLTWHANYLDEHNPNREDRRTVSAICRGLWALASKIQHAYK